MKKLLCGLAVLPFLSTVALAQPAASGPTTHPMQLTEHQMDSVTAGWSLLESDLSNTSWTQVSVWQPTNTISCSSCFLNLESPSLSVASFFGTTPTP